MAGEVPVTIIGNLTADPRLEFTNNGLAVCSFTVASTPRTFSRKTNQFEDGQTMYIDCQVWREAADNVADTLKKGMRVIATGQLSIRNYERKDGSRGTAVELKNVEVGPSLRYARANVERNPVSGGQGNYQNSSRPAQSGYSSGGYGMSQERGNGYGESHGGYDGPQGGSPNDPWAHEPRNADSDFNNEPPF